MKNIQFSKKFAREMVKNEYEWRDIVNKIYSEVIFESQVGFDYCALIREKVCSKERYGFISILSGQSNWLFPIYDAIKESNEKLSIINKILPELIASTKWFDIHFYKDTALQYFKEKDWSCEDWGENYDFLQFKDRVINY